MKDIATAALAVLREAGIENAAELAIKIHAAVYDDPSDRPIQDIVAKYLAEANNHFARTRVTMPELMGKSRKRHIVEVRQFVQWAMCSFERLSLQTIADHTGRDDHSTIIYSRDAVEDLCTWDKRYIEFKSHLLKVYGLKVTPAEGNFVKPYLEGKFATV